MQASDTVAEGLVISQGTTAGTQVAKNTSIVLTISSGKDIVEVTIPDVKGKSEADATQELKALKLSVFVDYAYDDSVAQGNVISYSPTGKTTEGSTVTIVVSRGEEPSPDVTMIDLRGFTDSAAENWLNNNGLNAAILYDVQGGTKGTVATQDYAAGAAVPKGTKVTIHIYLGTEQTTTTGNGNNQGGNNGGAGNGVQ